MQVFTIFADEDHGVELVLVECITGHPLPQCAAFVSSLCTLLLHCLLERAARSGLDLVQNGGLDWRADCLCCKLDTDLGLGADSSLDLRALQSLCGRLEAIRDFRIELLRARANKPPVSKCFLSFREPHGTNSEAGDILAAEKSPTSALVQCTVHLLKIASPAIFSEEVKSVARLYHDRCNVPWIDVQGLHHCPGVLLFSIIPIFDGYSADSCRAVFTPEDRRIAFLSRVSCFHRDIMQRRELARVWGPCVRCSPPTRGSIAIGGRVASMETCIVCAPPTFVLVFTIKACATNAELHSIAHVIFARPKFTARV